MTRIVKAPDERRSELSRSFWVQYNEYYRFLGSGS
jgi:hypothetical protein